MLKTKRIIIGIDEYEIIHNAAMGGTHLGSINPYSCEIKMREIGFDNRPIKKRMYYKVLMHEIVHGIDFNTFFVGEDAGAENIKPSEDVIDLMTVFILKNLKRLTVEREDMFEELAVYAEICEYKIERLQLFFFGVLDVIDDNPALMEEFLEVYQG